jgi:hypothetical protein
MSSHKNVHEAMLAFSAQFTGAHKTGLNPHFKSEHFTLDDVMRATNPLLLEHGMYAAHNMICIDGERHAVQTTITHAESNTIISSGIPLPQINDPQKIGSAITYYKRYNLCALLNIAEADDDGNAASVPEPKPERPAQPLADDTQHLLIQDYIEAGKVPEAGVTWYMDRRDTLTKTHAAEFIKKLKEKNK